MKQPNQSYWESELYNQSYDLIVIGAGLTGLSAAFFFKKDHPNANVLVIDRGFYPIGASTRNAGFACIGSVGELIADLEIETPDVVKQRIKDRYEGLLLLRETLTDDKLEYDDCGGWEIFTNTQNFEELKKSVPMLNTWMAEMIGEKEVFKVDEYSGLPSFYNRLEGQLHPGKMIQSLYQKCIQSGIEFRWNTTIENIDRDSNELTSEQGHIFSGENIILATNAFTSKIFPEIGITPGRGYVFVTNELEQINWKGTFHYEKGYVYFRNIGNNRILLGGGRHMNYNEETTSEFGVNTTIKDYLISFADDVLGLPQNWEMEHEWSGIMGFTESKSALLKKVGTNCVLAAGLSGMGVALGMNLGKKAADLL